LAPPLAPAARLLANPGGSSPPARGACAASRPSAAGARARARARSSRPAVAHCTRLRKLRARSSRLACGTSPVAPRSSPAAPRLWHLAARSSPVAPRLWHLAARSSPVAACQAPRQLGPVGEGLPQVASRRAARSPARSPAPRLRCGSHRRRPRPTTRRNAVATIPSHAALRVASRGLAGPACPGSRAPAAAGASAAARRARRAAAPSPDTSRRSGEPPRRWRAASRSRPPPGEPRGGASGTRGPSPLCLGGRGDDGEDDGMGGCSGGARDPPGRGLPPRSRAERGRRRPSARARVPLAASLRAPGRTRAQAGRGLPVGRDGR